MAFINLLLIYYTTNRVHPIPQGMMCQEEDCLACYFHQHAKPRWRQRRLWWSREENSEGRNFTALQRRTFIILKLERKKETTGLLYPPNRSSCRELVATETTRDKEMERDGVDAPLLMQCTLQSIQSLCAIGFGVHRWLTVLPQYFYNSFNKGVVTGWISSGSWPSSAVITIILGFTLIP